MPSAQDIIDLLKLVPLMVEGGYFRETYRSALEIPAAALPPEYPSDRSASTAIYYLLTPETFSVVHQLAGDEVFHFYAGDPVEMLQLWPDGTGRVERFGNDLAAGLVPQIVVPGGVWQGCRLAAGGQWALLGCTVAPGFDYADFVAGDRAALTAQYPEYAARIATLTAE